VNCDLASATLPDTYLVWKMTFWQPACPVQNAKQVQVLCLRKLSSRTPSESRRVKHIALWVPSLLCFDCLARVTDDHISLYSEAITASSQEEASDPFCPLLICFMMMSQMVSTNVPREQQSLHTVVWSWHLAWFKDFYQLGFTNNHQMAWVG